MPKIHQEVRFSAPPAAVYEALLKPRQTHAQSTGAPAQIEAKVGARGPHTAARSRHSNIELVDGVRIVQTWRAGNWPAGSHLLVKIELSADGNGTKLTLTTRRGDRRASTALGRRLGEDVLGADAQVLLGLTGADHDEPSDAQLFGCASAKPALHTQPRSCI